MMLIVVNQKKCEIASDVTLEMALELCGYGGQFLGAVAVNGTVVPRSEWPKHCLSENDQLWVVAPMQGG